MQPAGKTNSVASQAAAAANAANQLNRQGAGAGSPGGGVEGEPLKVKVPGTLHLDARTNTLPNQARTKGQQGPAPVVSQSRMYGENVAADPGMQQQQFQMPWQPQPWELYSMQMAMAMNQAAAMGMPPWPQWPYHPQAANGMYPGAMSMATQPQGSEGGRLREKGDNAAVKATKSRDRRKRGSKAKGKMEESPPSPADAEDGTTIHCAALQEVRKHQGKCQVLFEEVLTNSVDFAKDQHGSRYLQALLESASDKEKDDLLQKLIPEAAMLASDTFGNHVIQKFFIKCNQNQAQQKALISALRPDIYNLTNEPHGCRVMQTAIIEAATDSQQIIAKELELSEKVAACIESPHGNHVIQKCIERMPPDFVKFIIEAIEKETDKMAKHRYGCRVIQRLLEHCTAEMLDPVLKKILSNADQLAQDQYGNYVVQHVLEHGALEDKKYIIQEVQKNVLVLAKHKSSSNVVEKCFDVLTISDQAPLLKQERDALYDTVLGQAGDQSAPIFEMMVDNFGNYIVQKMMENSIGPQRKLLKEKISSAQEKLQMSPIGRHIMEKMEKMEKS